MYFDGRVVGWHECKAKFDRLKGSPEEELRARNRRPFCLEISDQRLYTVTLTKSIASSRCTASPPPPLSLPPPQGSLALSGGELLPHGVDGGLVGVLGAGSLEDGGAGDEHVDAGLAALADVVDLGGRGRERGRGEREGGEREREREREYEEVQS